MLWSTLRKSFIPVRCSTSWKMATSRVGVMAMERVSSTRAKRDQRRFRKPFADMKVKMWAHVHFFKTISRWRSSSYLHHKLARVGACHCGTLSCCQDAYCPDVKGCRPKKTAQDHSLKNVKTTSLLSRNIWPIIFDISRKCLLADWNQGYF